MQPEAILAISSSEESSTKSENEKRKSKKSKKRKDKKKEHERSPEHDEDDIPLDQMMKVHIDHEANEALEGSGFQVLEILSFWKFIQTISNLSYHYILCFR